MTIHGDGSQTRSFTYIDDLISGIVAAAESESAAGEIINLGSDEEISILKLAESINELVRPGKQPQIEFVSYESFGGKYEDVKRRIPDLTKAKKMIGFRWKTKLVAGLRKTIEWHKRA